MNRIQIGAVTAALLAGVLAVPASAADSSNPASAATPSKTVVTPVLKGLVFLSGPQNFQINGVSKPGIDATRVPMLNNKKFTARLPVRLGRPLTLDGLNGVTHAVVSYYRAHHHALVDAVAPQQNVQSGVIQIVVTEYRVGAVRAQGNRWFSERIVTAPITLRHGDTVDSARLINQLDAANSNPFRRVNLVYQPNAEPGYTDVVLQTQDRFPVRVFSGFDNSGTPVTGRNRWNMGASWGNALWHDQQISYQLTTSNDFFSGRSRSEGQPGGASFTGQTLSWSIPVFGADSVTLLGSYDRSVPNLGQDFGLVGRSAQASVRYNHSLYRTRSLIHNLQAGYDYKSTNNNLAFGGREVSRTAVSINQFSLGYTASLSDAFGSSSLSTTLFYSPGNLAGHNTTADFQPADGQSCREFASAHYIYWRSDFNRLTRLPAQAVWSLRMLGQTSNANLLYTEQLGGGGPEILRGYDPNAMLGDRGFLMSNELRSPSFHKASETQLGQVQLLAFWDFGHINSVHDAPGALNHMNASSVGGGLRYNLRANMTARCDYGWQLQHLPNADSRSQQASFSLVLAY